MALAWRCAGAPGNADQQPLPAKLGQLQRLAVQGRHGNVRQWFLRIDELAVVAAPLGTNHVIREVRGHDGRGAYRQHGQHLQPTQGRAAAVALHCFLGLGKRVHRQVQRLVTHGGFAGPGVAGGGGR